MKKYLFFSLGVVFFFSCSNPKPAEEVAVEKTTQEKTTQEKTIPESETSEEKKVVEENKEKVPETDAGGKEQIVEVVQEIQAREIDLLWKTYPARDVNKGAEPTGKLEQKFIKNAVARKAVCNDGSPADYYIRYGTGQNRSNWIIHLKGGSACQTIESCEQRWKNDKDLMSSKTHPASKDFEGMMNPSKAKNPDFYNWTHVHLYYCSSDDHIGDKEASKETGNYHFRGKRIVKAFLADLADATVTTAPTLQEAKLVVFAGSSAGASGMRHNLNMFANVATWASIVGVSDSAFRPSAATIQGKPEKEDNDSAQNKLDFWNAQVDEECLKGEKDAVKCFGITSFFQYQKTRHFGFMDQSDQLTTSDWGIQGDPAKMDLFAKGIRDFLRPLPGAFSTNSTYHTGILNDKRFHETKVKQLSYGEVLANYLFDRSGLKNVIKE